MKQGAALVLPVNFTGSPRPKVTWTYRGVPLTSRPGHVHIESGDGYSTLSVFGIEAGEAGKYEVVVDNVAGTTKMDFNVVVKCTCAFNQSGGDFRPGPRGGLSPVLMQAYSF